MSHSVPNKENYDFVDISQEQHREYKKDGETVLAIENPVALFVKPSGSHRVLAKNGEMYDSYYVRADAWDAIRWVIEPGEHEFFNGWGERARENTGIEQQGQVRAAEGEAKMGVGTGLSSEV